VRRATTEGVSETVIAAVLLLHERSVADIEDPLLLFTVLYGLWNANNIAFNGAVSRELATQFKRGKRDQS
jgi:hypothetical protein